MERHAEYYLQRHRRIRNGPYVNSSTVYHVMQFDIAMMIESTYELYSRTGP